MKVMILDNSRDPMFRISRKHQEKGKKILANNGTIGTKMDFEGLSRHTV